MCAVYDCQSIYTTVSPRVGINITFFQDVVEHWDDFPSEPFSSQCFWVRFPDLVIGMA